MIFYTADLHLGSEDVIEKAKRHFASPQEMDEAIVRRWNAAVSEQDTVYLVGDVGNHDAPIPEQALRRLRGHKHLIRGNHDACIEDQEKLLDYFESVTDFLEIDDGAYHITLCHYPLVYMQAGYMVHGHLHNAQGRAYQLLKQLPRTLNAGVDVNDFRPVTLAQLIENNRSFYGGEPARQADAAPRRPKWEARFYPLPQGKRPESKKSR